LAKRGGLRDGKERNRSRVSGVACAEVGYAVVEDEEEDWEEMFATGQLRRREGQSVLVATRSRLWLT